jgi:hypothetical protein
MTVADAIRRRTTVRVWHASRDSRVGIATEFPAVEGASRFAVQLLNRPNLKVMQLSESELNDEWQLEAQTELKWLNVGSVWVPNAFHKFWSRPVPKKDTVIIQRPIASGGTVWYESVDPKNNPSLRGALPCSLFVSRYTRLWGEEVPKGEIPLEPLPYLARKLPGRPPRKVEGPKRAIDRLLEEELIPE